MNKTRFLFFIFFLFAFIGFYLHARVVGSVVWGDGQYYYAYVRSLVVDRDLNFQNELEYFSRPIQMTKTGMVANKYSLGPAILWLPFFLLAHLFARSDGYSHLYQMMVGLGSVFYGTAGLWFCFKIVKKYFSTQTSLIATFAIWLTSNLFFYTVVDPINSHSVSFFISSLIVYLLVLSTSEESPIKSGPPSEVSLVLGFLVGLLTLIRNQDIIFVIPILMLIGFNIKTLIFISSLFLTFLPQLFVWQYLYGQIFNPYLIGGEKFNWLNPQILLVLFNSANGLFLYSPILIFSSIGIYYLYKKSKILAISGTLLFSLETYIISSWHYWTQGASYGGRMFISLMPFFIIGLAAFIDRFKKRAKIIYPLFSLLIIMNLISIIRFLLTNP